MLLFEFFPAFVALVGLIAVVGLIVANQQARTDGSAGTTTESRRTRTAAVVVVVCVLAAGSIAHAQTQADTKSGVADLSRSLEATAKQVEPAVVEIFTTIYRAGTGLVPSNADLVSTERASGSGVIVDPNGFIVTNAHVVAGANRLEVNIPLPASGQSILSNRGLRVPGELVGLDIETDLAVIKINETGLPVLTFADSDALATGQIVMAFGSPLGLSRSASLGIVSAVARQLEPESPMIYVQTDAAINHGSSGGPLVDVQGRIVGINTLLVSETGGDDGLGFAAPSNIVRTVYEQIRQFGRVRRGDIGIRAQTVTPVLAAGLGLPRAYGAVLADVYPGSAAARASLRAGDLVLSLDGKPIENGRQLLVGLYRRFVGEKVSLEIARNGTTATVLVTITERGDPFADLPASVDPRSNLVTRLGILGVDLNRRLAESLPVVRVPSGVVVAATAAGAVDTAQGGLAAGDVIYAVNRIPVQGLSDLRGRLDGLRPGDPVVLQLERRGQMIYLAFAAE